jgi:uncharacterized protein YcbK (DUF882 family)
VRLLTVAATCAVALVSTLAYGDAPKPLPPLPKPTASVAAKPAPPPPKKPAPAGPVTASRGWHQATPGKTCPVDPSGRPQLVLQALNMPDHATLTAHGEHGGFSAEDLDKAAHVLRDPRTGNEHPVDPHTLDLVYRVAAHFNVQEVRIISGYRTPRPGTHSNHGNGRAIDCVFAGVSDEEVAKYARDEGFTGVGTYPVSGFVHLDVREHSYFWVDSSGPGKRNRTRGILGDVAAKSDARAVARGDHSPNPFGIGNDVDGALAASLHNAPVQTPDDDDEDDEAQ